MKKKGSFNVSEIFANWYAQNESRFAIRLVKTPYRKGHKYTFDGITNFISLFIDEKEIAVWVHFDGKAVDMIQDIDIDLQYKAKKGYYCSYCKKPKYFKTAEELYIKHSFEEILYWVNNTLATAKYLEISFRGNRGGSSEATLDTQFKQPPLFKRPYYYFKSLYFNKKHNIQSIKIKLPRRRKI